MQTNLNSIPPPDSQETMIVPYQEKGQDATRSLEAQIFSPSPSVLESKTLQSKSIKAGQVRWKDAIVRFYQRHFSPISLQEQEHAHHIKKLAGEVERALSQAETTARKAQQAERQLAGEYPSQHTLQVWTAYLKEVQPFFLHAQECLAELQAKKSEVEALAEAHASFDALLKDIKGLQERVSHLENKIEIVHRMLDLEEAMKDYQPQESWDQFVKIKEQRELLAKTMKRLLSSHARFQSYIRKSQWTAVDIHTLIKAYSPDLTHQIERLFDHTIQISEKRRKNLTLQVNQLHVLFFHYTTQVRRIQNLEKYLYGSSLVDRVYRFFHDRKKLQQQLIEARRAIAQVHEAIQQQGQFIPAELEWLKEMASFKPSTSYLLEEIVHIQKTLHFLAMQEKISLQIDGLNSALKQYQDNLERLAETPSKSTQAFIDQLKTEIFSQFQTLYSLAPPTSFEREPPFAQLKKWISKLFPNLQPKLQRLEDLIERQQLQQLYQVDQTNSDEDNHLARPLIDDSTQPADEQVTTLPERPDHLAFVETLSASQESSRFQNTEVPPPAPPPPPTSSETINASSPLLRQRHDLLEEIRKQGGAIPQKASLSSKNFSIRPPNARTYGEILELVRLGKLKTKDIPPQEREALQLTLRQILELEAAERRILMREDEQEEETEEWQD